MWELSACPVGRTRCFHCKAWGSVPGPGSMIPKATWCGDKEVLYDYIQKSNIHNIKATL